MSVWSELRRRKVVRVAVGYAIGAWVLLQLTDVLVSLLDLPGLIGRVVVLFVVICFPVVMTFAWVFDITPGGVIRDQKRMERRFGVRIDYILLAALLLLTGWFLYRFWLHENGPDESATTTTTVAEQVRKTISAPLENSVAILPFENLSPDPNNAYFAAGLHEEVLHQLTRIEDLKVTSRKSVLQYASKDIGIPEIAGELSVGAVMEGSARFSGNEVRIQAQLIDGETDEHLWAEVYQRELTDIFSIQADIAERIAVQFKLQFLPEDRQYIESQTSKSPQALSNYLHALSLNWGGSQDKDRALALLDESIALDPDFAVAIALRALVHATSLNNTPESRDNWRASKLQIEQIARSDAERALELDERQGKAYVALARINQYRWKGAEARQSYEMGLRITPNDVDLLRGFAWYNSVARNHEYAIELAERAVRLDPVSAAAHAELGQRLTFAGKWDAAYASHSTAVSLEPDNGIYHLRVANNEIARSNLAHALSELQTAEALIELSNASPGLLAEFAYAYSRAGNKVDARRLVGMIESESLTKHVGVGERAMSLLALDQYPEALVLLQQAVVEIINNGIIDGGFKSLVQISANTLADPGLEQAEFLETRDQLTFRE